jgi:hypothetical protein
MSSNIHYINDSERVTDARTITGTMNAAKEEFKQFAETRLAMLQAEMKEKLTAMKASLPMLVIGGAVALTSFLVLTAALICVLWTVFTPSPYAPFLACVIVGVAYALVGFGALFLGYNRLTEKGLIPERTIKVLKEDKVWLQNEARTQL